jgi:hypothetical protein
MARDEPEIAPSASWLPAPRLSAQSLAVAAGASLVGSPDERRNSAAYEPDEGSDCRGRDRELEDGEPRRRRIGEQANNEAHDATNRSRNDRAKQRPPKYWGFHSEERRPDHRVNLHRHRRNDPCACAVRMR